MLPKPPRYCRHKARNLAYVRISDEQIYLGPWNSPESRERYDELIIQWRRDHDVTGQLSLTLGQLCILFTKHADDYYRRPDGTPTGEANNIRGALKHVCMMYRAVPVCEFGPMKLKAVRQRMIDRGVVRTNINRHIARVKQMVKWGVENEMIQAGVHMALSTVRGLRPGRSAAVESEPVMPVPQGDIDAALPYMTPTVQAMVRLQLLTGMRPSEARAMCCKDIDQTGTVWVYTPQEHKTRHWGKRRLVLIGPRGQLVLRQYLTNDPELFVFRPAVGRSEYITQHCREGAAVVVRNADGDNKPYTHCGYDSSIRRACKRAGVTPWSPGRLRHNAGTNIRKEIGDVDAARVILGHSDTTVTTIYAMRDLARAKEVMLQIG
jgi:integrase